MHDCNFISKSSRASCSYRCILWQYRTANVKIWKTTQRKPSTKIRWNILKLFDYSIHWVFIKDLQTLFSRDAVNRHSAPYSHSNNDLCRRQAKIFRSLVIQYSRNSCWKFGVIIHRFYQLILLPHRYARIINGSKNLVRKETTPQLYLASFFENGFALNHT